MLPQIGLLIDFKLCKEILQQPVNLPCGETICAKHEGLFRHMRTSGCQFCNKYHALGLFEHFSMNKVAQQLLDAEINKLDFGKDYKQALKNYSNLRSLEKKYQEMKNSADDLVSERFQQMRS
jgi:hypothetical protein